MCYKNGYLRKQVIFISSIVLYTELPNIKYGGTCTYQWAWVD